MCKIFPFDVVVRLDEDLSEDGLSYWVVLGVELVKPVERVAVLFLGGDLTPLVQESTTINNNNSRLQDFCRLIQSLQGSFGEFDVGRL